jgi:hypothetical protein
MKIYRIQGEKMKTLGLRVSPKVVTFCIADRVGDLVNVDIVDKINVPVMMTEPDRLSFLRNIVFTIINQYEVESAVIRRMEDNSRTISITRANIEGVLQELISNCRVSYYKACKLSQLSSLLHKTASELKECVNGENAFEIDNWQKFSSEERESILCALAASELWEE